MKLHLLRHAKTDQWSVTGRDFDRRLLPKGIAQSNVLGEHLPGMNVQQVWCSSAVRTRETLSILQHYQSFKDVQYSDGLYLCSREDLLKSLWNHKQSGDVFIIGHNFGISDLATYLTDEHIELRTCEYICIEFAGAKSWAETSGGTGDIRYRYRPKVLLP